VYGEPRQYRPKKNKSSFTLDQALLRTDDAFKKNNFGILDALHSSIGEGVYPCAALLNHSCAPNAILRYKLDSGATGGRRRGVQYSFPLHCLLDDAIAVWIIIIMIERLV
jgi:hypothetical protein